MASEIYNVIDALSREKGIDPQIVVSAVEDAIVAATRKKEKSQENLKGELDKESGMIRVYAVKSILPSEDDIEDPQLETLVIAAMQFAQQLSLRLQFRGQDQACDTTDVIRCGESFGNGG